KYEMPFNCPLQMPSTIFHVCTFAKQEFLGFVGATEDELALGLRRHNSRLNFVEFNIQDLSHIGSSQCAKYHDLIQPVHEFRRKLSLGCFHSSTVKLPVR